MPDLDQIYRGIDSNGKGLSQEDFTTELKADLENAKYSLDPLSTKAKFSPGANSSLNVTTNILTIGIGQTGNGANFGFYQSDAVGNLTGEILETDMVIEIVNYSQLSQPLSFTLYSQRLANNSLIQNTTINPSFTDVVSGSTLTRTYKISQTLTASDFQNRYYYRHIAIINNTTPVSQNVTISVTGKLVKKTFMNSAVVGGTRVVDKSLRWLLGQYNGMTQVHVKKDNSRDFVDIQSAIDSIGDATFLNQYEVIIHDNWSFTSRSQLKGGAVGSSNHSYVFNTKDYVNVRGWGSRKKISVVQAIGASAVDIEYTQCVLFDGMSRLDNLEMVLGVGRYPVHRDNVKNTDSYSEIRDCRIEHLGNDTATNFNSWKSDFAFGYGTASGERHRSINTQFIARKRPITLHTNINFTNPNYITFQSCNFVSRLGSPSDDSDRSMVMNAANLGSNQRNTLELIGCSGIGHLDLQWSSYVNTTNRSDAFTHFWHLVGYGNQPFSLYYFSLGVLKFTAVNFSQNVYVNGGSAQNLIFGASEYTRKRGCSDEKGYVVGSVYIENGTNGYQPVSYMQNLGHLLGDCSVSNKTLIVNVNGIDRTITFNKNYSGGSNTSAPAYTNQQIVDEMNTALSTYAVASIGWSEFYSEISDTFTVCRNTSASETIFKGMGVMIDRNGGCRKAVSGEKPDGIAMIEIQHSSAPGLPDTGKVILRGKSLIHKYVSGAPSGYGAGADITGVMLKIGSTPGQFITTSTVSEAVLIGIDHETWKFMP